MKYNMKRSFTYTQGDEDKHELKRQKTVNEEVIEKMAASIPDFEDFLSAESKEVQDLCKQRLVGNKCSHINDKLCPNSEVWKKQLDKVQGLKKEWFENKRVFQIGSYDGLLSVLIACIFKPSLLIGCDIDHNLTKKAMQTVHECINDEVTMPEVEKLI
jgi:hypothetical protein